MTLRSDSGDEIRLGRRLGGGGQGEVFEVTSHPGQVFKRYLHTAMAADPTLERRLSVMLANPPAGWREPGSDHLTMSWPISRVLNDGRFVGFLMPEIQMAKTVSLHRITNPSDRIRAEGDTSWVRNFNWKYMVRAAANLAHAVSLLHVGGTVIGDFNEANVRVSHQALVTLLDCDSMQISDPSTGERFYCAVGRPEFTPPELLNVDWKNTFRLPSSDLFALAIHIYQILLEGEHPFRGKWRGAGEKPTVPALASQGIWALRPGGPLSVRPSAVRTGLLPSPIIGLFRQAFEDGAIRPEARPAAFQWEEALNSLEQQMQQCRANPAHFYASVQGRCPWCELTRNSSQRTLQRPLPSATLYSVPHSSLQLPAANPLPVVSPPEGLRSRRVAEEQLSEADRIDEVLILDPDRTAPGQDSIRRRIQLGWPEPLSVTPNALKKIRHLANLVSSRKDLTVCLLWITPTFHEGDNGVIAEAFVEVKLEIPGIQNNGVLKIWSMKPGAVEEETDHSRNVGGSGSLKVGHAGVDSTVSYKKHQPFIQAYGLQLPEGYWKFTRTRGREIRGSQKLEMTICMPRDHDVSASFKIYGTARGRKFGLFPRTEELTGDSSSIILAADAIGQVAMSASEAGKLR